MDDAAEMTPQTTSSAGGGGNDFQNFEETHQLLHPLSHHTQVTHPPSSSPSHSSSRKSSKKKSHRKRRQGSVSQSVADSKYSTNSPSSSTVNDEILVPLTVGLDAWKPEDDYPDISIWICWNTLPQSTTYHCCGTRHPDLNGSELERIPAGSRTPTTLFDSSQELDHRRLL
ncbi:uncharacterized protein LOC119161481 isoform X3 [Rhipicephalus microplus]|uniref:uncharacterized protein LOC119161481 isoform X3 n=1 Tax=Rhipicephalus microplus TaxID=6941 RepID=UPI003F6B6643